MTRATTTLAMLKRLFVAALAGLCSLFACMPVCRADGSELKNWFNDPYFQVSKAIPGCPVPRGPLMRADEVKQEEHSRVERGTSCWMAGRCTKPNAYMYDAGIGKAVQVRFAQGNAFADTSLWVTVKRKFVWVEGCIADPAQEAALQQLLQNVPDAEHILINVMQGTGAKPPYEALEQ